MVVTARMYKDVFSTGDVEKSRHLGVDQPLDHVVPHDARNFCCRVVAKQRYAPHEITEGVVDVDLALRGDKEDLLGVWGPFDVLKLHLQLLAPQAVPIH